MATKNIDKSNVVRATKRPCPDCGMKGMVEACKSPQPTDDGRAIEYAWFAKCTYCGSVVA